MNLISSMLTSASLLPIPHTIAVISAMAFSSSSSSGSLKNPNFKVEEEEEKLRLVLKYHNQTKHSFTGYARGPRGLDWANQPNPFRKYLSAPLLPLQHQNQSHDSDDDSLLYSSLFDSLPPLKPISLHHPSPFDSEESTVNAIKPVTSLLIKMFDLVCVLCSLIVVFIMHTREWLCCLTSMKLILPSLMSS